MLSPPVRQLLCSNIVVSFGSKKLLCVDFISSWSALEIEVTYPETGVSKNDRRAP